MGCRMQDALVHWSVRAGSHPVHPVPPPRWPSNPQGLVPLAGPFALMFFPPRGAGKQVPCLSPALPTQLEGPMQ